MTPEQRETEEALTRLCWEFQEWTAREGLSEEGDAQELFFSPNVTDDQLLWLSDFMRRWDVASEQNIEAWRAEPSHG